jgi:acyl-CoA synthetase (AMP-forming)/AMP-acid ligase II
MQSSKVINNETFVYKAEKQAIPMYCDCLDTHAMQLPNKQLLASLDKNGDITQELTSSEFVCQSKNIAAHLLQKGIQKGDRVLVIYPVDDVIDYLLAFVACMRIGAVVVSIYPPNPTKLNTDLPKFQNFINNSAATVALTNTVYKRFVQVSSKLRKWPKEINEWIATDSLAKKHLKLPKGFCNVQLGPKELIFIQFTSGSTGIF